MSVFHRLGYEGQRRRREHWRRLRQYGSSYGGAWSRWNHSYNYQPSYDSSGEWIDYDYPENFVDYGDWTMPRKGYGDSDYPGYISDYGDWTKAPQSYSDWTKVPEGYSDWTQAPQSYIGM